MPHPDLEGIKPEEFWDGIYGKASSQSSGQPSKILALFAERRAPGHALDLGCAKGDDAIWLARQGWQVLGVDVSQSALRITTENAARNDVADRVRVEQHDLSKSFPKGAFDLVSASFLQTPFDFPRAAVLQSAAAVVRPSGLLLIATHQTYAPWSWNDSSEPEITAEERLAEIALDPVEWRQVFVGPFHRVATGPDGQQADVTDAVVALERLDSR